MTATTEVFRPDRVKRIKWSNGTEVVSVHDYDKLLSLYRDSESRLEEIRSDLRVVQGNFWRHKSE